MVAWRCNVRQQCEACCRCWPLSHAPTAAPSVFASGTVVMHRSYEMSGQLTLLALFVFLDGCTASHHRRPDGLALQSTPEV